MTSLFVSISSILSIIIFLKFPVLYNNFIILFLSLLDQKILIRLSVVLFVITFISLFLVPLIGVEVKGSKRWLDIGSLPRFQPIETLKPFFVIVLSLILNH